jgi:hypothetical protein
MFKRVTCLILLTTGCSDFLKPHIDTGHIIIYDVIGTSTTNITEAEATDTGCDSGELCDTAG